jgi:hypothetical protein
MIALSAGRDGRISLKTAKALGFAMPPSMLASDDEMIE